MARIMPTYLMLCLLAFPALPAAADVKGIPFNEAFATARYPHARVIGGCTEWRRPERYGDSWGSVQFGDACGAHDRCYHTPGASWGDCNHRFLSDLRAACARDLKRERLEKGRPGQPDAQALRLCYDIADVYYRRVQTADAAKRFEFAQTQEKAYLTFVADVINGIYRSVLRRDASRKEKERLLNSLATTDATLNDLKATLMGESLEKSGGEPESLSADLPVLEDDKVDSAPGADQPEAQPAETMKTAAAMGADTLLP